MKVLLFYFNSLQPSGGIERVIVTLANKMCYQYDITILVKDEAKTFYELDSRIQLISIDNELNFNMNNKVSRAFSVFNSVIKNGKALKEFLKFFSYDYYYLLRGMRNRDLILDHCFF